MEIYSEKCYNFNFALAQFWIEHISSFIKLNKSYQPLNNNLRTNYGQKLISLFVSKFMIFKYIFLFFGQIHQWITKCFRNMCTTKTFEMGMFDSSLSTKLMLSVTQSCWAHTREVTNDEYIPFTNRIEISQEIWMNFYLIY